jgi:predicted transcriptional regulator YdeE
MIFTPYQFKPFRVMSLKVKRFPEEFHSTYSSVSNKMHDTTNRKLFGMMYFDKEPLNYSICIEQQKKDNPLVHGFESIILPGGSYIKTSLINWESKLESLQQVFIELKNKYLLDDKRPQIEEFKSKRELIIYFPIKKREEQLTIEF